MLFIGRSTGPRPACQRVVCFFYCPFFSFGLACRGPCNPPSLRLFLLTSIFVGIQLAVTGLKCNEPRLKIQVTGGMRGACKGCCARHLPEPRVNEKPPANSHQIRCESLRILDMLPASEPCSSGETDCRIF